MIDPELWIALASGLVLAALLVAGVNALARRFVLVRRLSLTLYVASLATGLKLFTLFGVVDVPGLDTTVSWLLAFLVALAVLQVAGLWFFQIHLHARGVRLPRLLPTVAMWTAYVVAAFVTLRLAFGEDLKLGPLLATSAITSLVIGLALQPILGNFFSGLVISLEKPFRLNDWIRYGDVEGRVVGVNWRTTYLRTRDNDDLVVPNSRIAEETILNFHYPLPLHLERIYVGVHYRHPPYEVRQALVAAAAGAAGVLAKPQPEVYVDDFADSAIRYEVRVWIEDFGDKPRILSEVRARIWEELKRRGFTIPFPIRTLEIEPQAARLEIARARRPGLAADEGPPPARLFVTRGRDRGRQLAFRGEVTIGRSDECEVSLADESVSWRHGRIAWEAATGRYAFEDLGSTHGSRINGRAETGGELAPFDRLTLGDCEMVFDVD